MMIPRQFSINPRAARFQRLRQAAQAYRGGMILVLLLAFAPAAVAIQPETRHMPEPRLQEAITLMSDFAERTGLVSGRPRQRYLWTDAFAVCNFLGLARATGEARYTALALRLIEQVHHTLGRHRDDDARSGWLSGLDEHEGESHPTRGGLRIGKTLPERGPNEPFDAELEWDRDGQYFHYLTKWMQALDQATRATARPQFTRWARELAATAYPAFSYSPSAGGPRRMYWKMSIDLSRPLVASMGQHDSLDAYVTCLQLRSTAAGMPAAAGIPDLEDETRQFRAMLEHGDWLTDDPLGLGGLLVDAWRLEQMRRQGAPVDEPLVEALLAAALAGLPYYTGSGELQRPAGYRLAFRELGLAIGLQAAADMWQAAGANTARASASPGVSARLHALMPYVAIGEELVAFWRDPAQRRAGSWSEHRDINEVMLATSLAPQGFLALAAPAASDPRQ
jgi:hypothetical protein